MAAPVMFAILGALTGQETFDFDLDANQRYMVQGYLTRVDAPQPHGQPIIPHDGQPIIPYQGSSTFAKLFMTVWFADGHVEGPDDGGTKLVPAHATRVTVGVQVNALARQQAEWVVWQL